MFSNIYSVEVLNLQRIGALFLVGRDISARYELNDIVLDKAIWRFCTKKRPGKGKVILRFQQA